MDLFRDSDVVNSLLKTNWRSFLCMCSRNCIFDIIIIIIIINIAFIVVVVMLQNRQVMVTSFGFSLV